MQTELAQFVQHSRVLSLSPSSSRVACSTSLVLVCPLLLSPSLQPRRSARRSSGLCVSLVPRPNPWPHTQAQPPASYPGPILGLVPRRSPLERVCFLLFKILGVSLYQTSFSLPVLCPLRHWHLLSFTRLPKLSTKMRSTFCPRRWVREREKRGFRKVAAEKQLRDRVAVGWKIEYQIHVLFHIENVLL